MSVADWLPLARLHSTGWQCAGLSAGPPRPRAAITTSELSPPVLTRAHCSTCQPCKETGGG